MAIPSLPSSSLPIGNSGRSLWAKLPDKISKESDKNTNAYKELNPGRVNFEFPKEERISGTVYRDIKRKTAYIKIDEKKDGKQKIIFNASIYHTKSNSVEQKDFVYSLVYENGKYTSTGYKLKSSICETAGKAAFLHTKDKFITPEEKGEFIKIVDYAIKQPAKADNNINPEDIVQILNHIKDGIPGLREK